MPVKQIFRVVISALFPNTCIACGEVIPEGEQLCEYCAEMSKKVDFTKCCIICGMNKKECVCSKRVFHFSGATAPFYNDGFMKEAMYSFKFGKREYISKFFAEKMAITVKTAYSEIDFDIITFVPTTFFKKLKRGFNQSEALAKQISEILKIKLYGNLISCKFGAEIQHDLNFEKRFKNVKGRYIANKKYKLNGKTVLLVDDIKTSGATLDECAKQLLLLGADRVYCVTGLMTAKNKKKEKSNGNRYWY